MRKAATEIPVHEMRELAYHEAGHVLANLHFNIDFASASICEDGSGCVDLLQSFPSNVTEAEPFTIALFAGHAAEHVICGSDLRVEGDDWDTVYSRVLPLFRSSERFDTFTDKMLSKAVRLMQLRRNEVRTIGDALFAKKRLSKQQMLNILSRS